MDFSNDEILVREIKKGNDTSYRYLRNNYLPSIVSVLMKGYNLLYHEAEYIANDAIVDGFMKIDQYNPNKGKLFSWLTRIAINSAINKFTRRKSVKTVPLEYNPESGKAANVEPLHHSENVRLQIEFHNAVGRLSQTDKQMVELLLEELTDREVAKELSISYDTARQRKSRLNKKIKGILLSSPLFKKIYLKEK